jgi:Zn-dependent protease with chaperone function
MQPAARPDVLAYPSPTASQFVVFIAAMITAGIFVGSWIHNQTVGDDWHRTVTRCLAAARAAPPPESSRPAVLARAAQEDQCRASAERRRAAFALGGAAGAAGLGGLILVVAPAVVSRRRRLKPPGKGLEPMAAKVDALAAEAGIARAPSLMIGSATSRDAFSYGIPGRYRIALPPAVAVRWRDEALFDPIVRHELAHVRHLDVPLAWLARSVWYALAPLLAVPVVEALISGDTSLLPGYVWRAALLALTVQLVSSALLRSRELDADVRAARASGQEPVARVVGMVREDATRPWYRRLLARHPTKEHRLAALERPELITRIGFVDGFAPALLAGFTVPLVLNAMTTLLTGSGRGGLATVIAVCVVAPLLAGSVGLGLARAALVGRVAGVRMQPASVAVGVAVGLLVGKSVSLADTGVGVAEGLGSIWWLVAMGVLAIGSVALCAGLAELWADAAPAFPTPRRAWVSLMVVESLLFGAVLWFGLTLEIGGRAGWAVAREWLAFAAATTLLVVTALVAAVGVVWALWSARRAAVTPAWLLERGEPGPWPTTGAGGPGRALATGVVAGAFAVAGPVLVRALAGPPESVGEQLDRYALLVWTGACAAGAAAVALIVRDRVSGAGVALAAAPLASLVTVAGWLTMNTILGGGLAPDFVGDVTRGPVALGLIAVACLAPAAFVGRRVRPGVPSLVALAAGVSIVATAAVALQRGSLLSESGQERGVSAVEQAARAAEDTVLPPGAVYVTIHVPEIGRRHGEIATAFQRLQGDPTVNAERVRHEVVAPMRALLVYARGVRPDRPAAPVHRAAIRAFEAGVAAYEALADALAAGAASDLPALRRASAQMEIELAAQDRHLTRWIGGVQRLQAAVQGG